MRRRRREREETSQRIARLTEQRDEARQDSAQQIDLNRRLCQQLADVRDELAEVRRQLATARAATPATLRRRLDLAERARAGLDTTLVELQQANESLYRELAARPAAVVTE